MEHCGNNGSSVAGLHHQEQNRDGSKLLLAQPYNPMLLRQGVQPGPHLLLETLREKITPKEAKQKWSEFEALQKTEEEGSPDWKA